MKRDLADYRTSQQQKSMTAILGERFASIVENPQTPTMRGAYLEPTAAIIDYLRARLPQGHAYRGIDLGGGPGALIKDLTAALPDLRIEFTNVDCSAELLAQDKVSKRTICGRIEEIIPQLGTFDIACMRYVLQYNSSAVQRDIVQRLRAVVPHGTVISQHCAPDTAEARRMNELFRSNILEGKLYRPAGEWTTGAEISSFASDAGFKSSRIYEAELCMSTFLTDRYELQPAETRELKAFLAAQDRLRIHVEAWD